jgi:hypothetical protein
VVSVLRREVSEFDPCHPIGLIHWNILHCESSWTHVSEEKKDIDKGRKEEGKSRNVLLKALNQLSPSFFLFPLIFCFPPSSPPTASPASASASCSASLGECPMTERGGVK